MEKMEKIAPDKVAWRFLFSYRLNSYGASKKSK